MISTPDRSCLMNAETQQRILDAVDAGFEAQLATTRDFVAIPSTRGAEGPCQDMIGDLLRARGYEVDDWHINADAQKVRRGLGPIENFFWRARAGVAPPRPKPGGGKPLTPRAPGGVGRAGPLERGAPPP